MNNWQEMFENQINSLRKEINLVEQDKTFLTRENATLHDRIKWLEEQLDKQHDELMEAKKNAQYYLEKLLNTKDDEWIQMHERHIKDIDNLREKH